MQTLTMTSDVRSGPYFPQDSSLRLLSADYAQVVEGMKPWLLGNGVKTIHMEPVCSAEMRGRVVAWVRDEVCCSAVA